MSCTIDDVTKLGLRIATVTAAESVEGSEKLLKVQVELGDEQRQIVSGIHKSYGPEELVGRQVILVSQLEPRTIFGVESNGMLLCANSETGPVLLSPITQVMAGATIQ
jgi:methionyl-tRNA synthetase